MYAYIVRRLALIIPTLLGIMIINFIVIQAAPGGPVEQMIAQVTGTAVEATARISGGNGDGEISSTVNQSNTSVSSSNSKYRGAQGLPPEMIKLANEKTQQIKSAYETIKHARGL